MQSDAVFAATKVKTLYFYAKYKKLYKGSPYKSQECVKYLVP